MLDTPTRRTTERTLSDADVEAIASQLEMALKRHFYQDLGKGLWGIIWKVIIGALLIIAGYGVSKGS